MNLVRARASAELTLFKSLNWRASRGESVIMKGLFGVVVECWWMMMNFLLFDFLFEILWMCSFFVFVDVSFARAKREEILGGVRATCSSIVCLWMLLCFVFCLSNVLILFVSLFECFLVFWSLMCVFFLCVYVWFNSRRSAFFFFFSVSRRESSDLMYVLVFVCLVCIFCKLCWCVLDVFVMVLFMCMEVCVDVVFMALIFWSKFSTRVSFVASCFLSLFLSWCCLLSVLFKCVFLDVRFFVWCFSVVIFVFFFCVDRERWCVFWFAFFWDRSSRRSSIFSLLIMMLCFFKIVFILVWSFVDFCCDVFNCLCSLFLIVLLFLVSVCIRFCISVNVFCNSRCLVLILCILVFWFCLFFMFGVL